jgi:glycerol-3-phosphate acyltransferase PlsY
VLFLYHVYYKNKEIKLYMELFAYSLLAFTLGSIPFSVILTKLYKGKDVRSVGDNNPGATNAWKIGGSIFGMIVLLIEFSKAIIPIYIAIHVGDITGNNLILISVLPILGHGFSPFLKFKGGKALAVTAGMWLALFGIEAFLALFISLAIVWTIQKNDAWTVNLSHLALFLYGMTVDISNQYFTLNNFLITWIIAAIFMVFKHRMELSELPKFRNIKRDFRRLV